MRPSGLEPPRRTISTRPSTLRVYQFRHGRRVGEYRAPPARSIRCPLAGGVAGGVRPSAVGHGPSPRAIEAAPERSIARAPLASVRGRRYCTNTCSLHPSIQPTRGSRDHGSDQTPAGDLRLHPQVLRQVRLPTDRARHRQGRGACLLLDRACAPIQPGEDRPSASRSLQAAGDRAARPRGWQRCGQRALDRTRRGSAAGGLRRRGPAGAGGGEHRGLHLRSGGRRG